VRKIERSNVGQTRAKNILSRLDSVLYISLTDRTRQRKCFMITKESRRGSLAEDGGGQPIKFQR
jgi:hypothetical protein